MSGILDAFNHGLRQIEAQRGWKRKPFRHPTTRADFEFDLNRINAIKAVMPRQPNVTALVMAQIPRELHACFVLAIDADPYFLASKAIFYQGLGGGLRLRNSPVIFETMLQRDRWGDRLIACKLSDADVSYLCLTLPNFKPKP